MSTIFRKYVYLFRKITKKLSTIFRKRQRRKILRLYMYKDLQSCKVAKFAKLCNVLIIFVLWWDIDFVCFVFGKPLCLIIRWLSELCNFASCKVSLCMKSASQHTATFRLSSSKETVICTPHICKLQDARRKAQICGYLL